MRIYPINRDDWLKLLLFPFKIYLPLGFVCLMVWRASTEGHRTKGSLAEAAGVVMLGYLLCATVFLLVATFQFFVKKRALVAETLLWAAAAFIIALLLLPWSAKS